MQTDIELYRELVMLDGDEGCTTSRRVASRFGKSNRHVLASIARLEAAIKSHSPDLGREMFRDSLYIDSRGKTQREVLINHDGFMLLAMRFTGNAALKWQLQFVAAFKWLVRLMAERAENNRLAAQFDIKEHASIADGSYHGTGLQRRKVEKIALQIEGDDIKAKLQSALPFSPQVQ